MLTVGGMKIMSLSLFLELRTSFELDVQLSLACNLGKVDTTLSNVLKFVHCFEICFFPCHLAVNPTGRATCSVIFVSVHSVS